jgi:LPXTG-motif cell wall-anchored protein
VSNLYPSLENPFYYGDENGVIRYFEHTDMKADGTNVTDTLGYIVDCSKQPEIYEDGYKVTKVVHKLGNNGKLVFEVETPDIDIPAEKKWAGGAKPSADTQVELMIYHVKPTETGAEEAIYQKSIILSAATNWKGIFTDMPILTEGYYAIAEKVPEGFHPQYSGQTKTLVIDNKNVLVAVVDTSDAAAIQVTRVTNIPTVELPETGGIGVGVYYALGFLLIAAAIVYITGNGSLRRKDVQ